MKSHTGVAAIINKINILRILAAAILNKDPDQIVVSHSAKFSLRLKESFAAAARYPEDMAKAKFIYFGDTNHGDTRLHNFFYGQTNMDRMAEAGVKHIFPEIEPAYQNSINALAESRISPAEYLQLSIVEAYKQAIAVGDSIDVTAFEDKNFLATKILKAQRLGEGLQRAQERGMKIHCLDDRKNLRVSDMRAVFSIMSSVESYAYKNFGCEKPFHGKLFIQALLSNPKKSAEMQKALGDSGIANLLQARMKDDKDLAARMMQAAGTDKGATLFGAGHAHDKDGLFDCLGQDQTLRVDLHTSRDMYADLLFSEHRNKGFKPHYLHILNEDKLLRIRSFG